MEKLEANPSLPVRCLALWLVMLALAGCDQAPPPATAKPEPAVDFNATKTKAEQGDAAGQNTLGDLYARGSGIPQDYTNAAKWYRLSAEQGFAAAQCNLAALYAAGAGVTNDAAEAVKWYRQAADKGSADAQYNLAQMLSVGRGAKRDAREAIRLYQLAAEQGDGLSQYNLARRYREGKDVPADAVQAYFWFTLAGANGVADAVPMRKILKKDMTRGQIAEAERKAAEFKSKASKVNPR
ncbi:MAG: sel1 repeat family protein [Verrucomicrobia bacterium]|nr:sel1 repeat family protein [Verrucomicrobiota bacterium]